MVGFRSLRLAAVCGLLGLLAVAGPVVAGSAAAVHIGEANNLYHFTPGTTYVNVGGKVTWTNGSDAPHTVTSDAGSELASSTIGAAATFSHTFSVAGTFAYHCSIHTYMAGKVVVLAAGVTPPPTDTLAPAERSGVDPSPRLLFVVLVAVSGAVLFWRRHRRAAQSDR